MKIGSLALNEPGAFKIGPFGSLLKKGELVDDGFAVAGIENVLPNQFVAGFRRYVTAAKFAELSQYRLMPDDVAVTTMGTIGRAAVVPGQCPGMIMDSHLFRLRVNQSIVLPEYLAFAINSASVRAQLDRYSVGSIMDGLNTSILARCTIPLPPLDEQRRIAAILRAADDERWRRRYTQSLSDGLLGEVFVRMFGDPATNPMGWEWKIVDELKALTRFSCVGGPFGSNLTTDNYVLIPGVPVIRGSNINSTAVTFIDDDFVYVTKDKADSLIQNMAYPGDLIFTQRGTLGQVGYIPLGARHSRYVVSQSQMKLTPNLSRCSPLYLYHYFLTDFARRQIEDRALATGVPHINLDILKSFPVMLPPMDLQQRFATLAADYQVTCRQQQESARQSDHLFETLLQQAFSGALGGAETRAESA